MADIAVVFHWAPPAMDAMDVSELLDWREQARIRNGVED